MPSVFPHQRAGSDRPLGGLMNQSMPRIATVGAIGAGVIKVKWRDRTSDRVDLSAWNAYKAGAPIPAVVAMLCRAAQRDPILMQAHYRPRRAGRPRKSG